MTMFDLIRRRSLRRGMTLVELLVVVSIMMILAAYVLPKLQLNSAGRRVREAARMVNVYLGVARTRAIETGRPCGVMFKRLEGVESAGSNILFQVEVPPPYAGDMTGAVVKVQDWTFIPGGGGFYNPGTASLKAVIRTSDFSDGLVRRGDQIQLNRQGPWYTILNDKNDDATLDMDVPLDANGFLTFTDPPVKDQNNDGWIDTHWLTLVRVYEPGVSSPWPKLQVSNSSWSSPVSFAIRRQPSQTMAPPLVLPTGTAVDLGASGTDGNSNLFVNGTGPVTVMFSPNGVVSKCYYDVSSAPESEVPTEPLFFLIGRQEQTGIGPAPNADADEEDMANWQILTNLWLTINPQSGTTSVSENAATPYWYVNTTLDGIDEAREFAKQSRNMRGR